MGNKSSTSLAARLFVVIAVVGLAGCAINGKSPKAWNGYTKLGQDSVDRNDLVTAESSYGAAVQEAEQFGPGNRRLSQSLGHLAAVRFSLRKYAEAEELCQRRIDMDQKRISTNSMDFARELLSLAEAQEAQQKFEQAEQNYLRAQAIANFWDTPSSPWMGLFIAKRARLYTMQGKLSAAEACFEESKGRLETLQRRLNATSLARMYVLIQIANLLNDYALLCEKQEAFTKAETMLEQSISLLEYQRGKSSPRLAVGLNNLARICAQEKKFTKAETVARRSLAIVEKSLAPTDPVRVETVQLLTSIQAQQLK